ncbi:MAG: serine protease [Goleter apudmare HA4340-LM2]|jgi:S1-C subfamily serine protease|nr:serine protease [Goleter apudmare HA4340-LM2]
MKRQMRLILAGLALVYNLIPLSAAVAGNGKEANKYFTNISQKQLAQADKSPLERPSLAKSNKQPLTPESIQASVVKIQAGCKAEVYWANNKKTYYVRAGSSGSGFFVSRDGKIATNAHVIDMSQKLDKCLQYLFEDFVIQLAGDYNFKLKELDRDDLKYFVENSQPTNIKYIQTVSLSNGRELPFKTIVSGLPGTAKDVAVIKIDVKNAPVLKLTDYNNVKVLDSVIVAGYPGLPDNIDNSKYPIASFTDGKVSAKKYFNGFPVLQISAPVTHGNSGGPVINNQGQVIGIVAFASEASGFNFAVPSNTIMQFLRQAGITNKDQVASR